MKRLNFIIIAALVMSESFGVSFCYGATQLQTLLTERFDHDFHVDKVFKPQGIECSKCHNIQLDRATGKATAESALKTSAFRTTAKEICHGCHRSSEPKNVGAPQTCFTCHASETSLGAIKPPNHSNVAWKSSHAVDARVAGDKCLNCHTTSQCVKCHAQRNDIEMRNHTRNFRFFHSVQARLQPQRCDTCHTKSFCVNCHLGRK